MLEQFSALVHKIYEGAINPSAWPEILAAVAASLDAERSVLLTPFAAPASGGFIFPHAISQDNIALWATRYQSADLWARRTVERGLMREGNVVLGHELVTDAELRASEWYREFLSRIEIFQMMGGIVFGADRPDVPMTGCSFFRGSRGAPFGEGQRALLRLLVPHLSRALGVMVRLRDAEFRVAASLHALNRIRCGILLLDEGGGVCFANSAGESILREDDGLRLEPRARSLGILRAQDPAAQAALERALQVSVQTVAAEVAHFADVIPVRRPSGSAAYAVQVSYLPESNPYALNAVIPRAVVFIKSDALATKPHPDLLQRIYSLTQAEARATLALSDGGSLEAVATELNVTLNTLKTHLKSIYAKTSVDNRARLTKLVLSLATG